MIMILQLKPDQQGEARNHQAAVFPPSSKRALEVAALRPSDCHHHFLLLTFIEDTNKSQDRD